MPLFRRRWAHVLFEFGTLVIVIVLSSLTASLTVLDAWEILFFGIIALVVGRHLISMDRLVLEDMPERLEKAVVAYSTERARGILLIGAIFVPALVPLAFSYIADLGLSSIPLIGTLVIILVIPLGMLAQGRSDIPK